MPDNERRSVNATRRNSASPYVKTTLNQREKVILLKHLKKNGRKNGGTSNDSDDITPV